MKKKSRRNIEEDISEDIEVGKKTTVRKNLKVKHDFVYTDGDEEEDRAFDDDDDSENIKSRRRKYKDTEPLNAEDRSKKE